MSPVRTPLLTAVLLLASAAPATAQRPAASGAINIPFEQMTLPNGLRVILAPDHSVPQVAVDVWYHVGSRNEKPGRTGFAHLFEHVMFTGSGHVPYGLHDKLTEGVGGTNNGSTTTDRTNYWQFVPSNYLESMLWTESDRMGFLLDKLDEAKFKAQRDIVQNERRQRIENQPYGRAFELLDAAIYPSSHPHSWPVVGYMPDLQAASLDDVKSFFRLYYAPSNATVAIVGDFQPAEAKALVRKYFRDLPRGAAIVRPKADPVTLSAAKRMTFEDRVQVPRLYLSWPTVGDDHRDAPALEFVAQILAGPRTARLTKSLVFDQQKAANVGAVNYTGQHVGRFQVTVTPRPGSSLTELESSVDSIIARFKTEGPTANEMARAQAGVETQFVLGLQSNIGKAEILNTGLVFHGNAGWYKKNYADLKAVTAADVKRVTNKYLGAGRVVLSIVPQGKPDQAARASASTVVTALPDGHYSMGTK